MSEWISVEDRLPNEGSFVVAARMYDYCDPDACVCDFLNGHFLLSTDGLLASNNDGGAEVEMDFKPTHWMLLPELPKEVSDVLHDLNSNNNSV
jgi:hypothetical protein